MVFLFTIIKKMVDYHTLKEGEALEKLGVGEKGLAAVGFFIIEGFKKIKLLHKEWNNKN